MDLSFYHGSRVTEDPNGPLLIQTAQSAVGALIVSDPDADPNVFKHNVPVLIKGSSDYSVVRKLGKTSKQLVDAIFDQVGTYVYIINVARGATERSTLSNIIGDRFERTGLHALRRCEGLFGRKVRPRLVAVPGHTSALAQDGITAIHATHNGANYVIPPVVKIVDPRPDGGFGAEAIAILTDDRVTGFIVTKPGFGYDFASPPTVTLTSGASGGAGATAECSVGTVANPVCSELPGLLAAIRAVAFVDGPDTTDEASVLWRNTMNSDRLYCIDPRVLVWDTDLNVAVPQPASPRLIGVQAMADKTEGFHRSVSNKPINGIDGVTRPVSYGEQANYLNESGVGTIIASDNGGWITWGNRTASDPTRLQMFLSVRRTTDFINEAIEEAYRSFNDAPMTPRNVRRLIQAGNAFMRVLRDNEAIYDGRVYFDPTRNSDSELAGGRLGLAVRYLVPPPMEDISVTQAYELSYFSVLRNAVLAEQDLSVNAVLYGR